MAELKISAPPFPNRDEYPFVATVRYRKLVIDIENLDGSVREGKDPNGKAWKTEFRGSHYGEIRGSKGTDGDALDVYIKNPPDDKANKAYIIHQNHPRTHPTKGGQYDEDKVVLGVSSAGEAKKLYLRHYNRKDFLRSITEMSLEPFKRYIFGENKAEKVADVATAFIRMKLRGDLPMATKNENGESTCETPGEKKRSEGVGRGLARGLGRGPLGRPFGTPEDEDEENICETPGKKKRSKGKGRGLARGKGKGPRGIPIGEKEKKATVSDMYKLGYEYGVREKLAQIAMPASLSGAMTGALPPPKTPSGGSKPDWPPSLPQHGGATTPIADVKQQMQGLQPGQLKSTLNAQ